MKSWENVLVSGVRTQVTSHHLKTWKREHWAQFYCRYVETKITRETQKPSRCKNFRFCQIFLCWSLWFYDLIMVGSQFYAEEWWNRVEGVVGSCAKIALINFLFMQLSQPLLRNLQSLCCYAVPSEPHEYLSFESSVQGLWFLTWYLLALYKWWPLCCS